MRGRRPGDAYTLYGFISKVINGKYVAICKYCDRQLQNTAHTRLKVHRKNCKAYSLLPKNDGYDIKAEQSVTLATSSMSIKKENQVAIKLPLICDGEFFNENGQCQICPKKPMISFSEATTGNLHKHLKRKHPEHYRKFMEKKQQRKSMQSRPIPTRLESYRAVKTDETPILKSKCFSSELPPLVTTSIEVVNFKTEIPPTSPNEPKVQEEEPEGLENVDTTDEYPYAEELEHLQDYLSDNNPLQSSRQDVIGAKGVFPSKLVHSKRLTSLKADKTRAEIDYFKQKTNYFAKELDNLKVERSLMLLQAKKLRLEIERLEMDD